MGVGSHSHDHQLVIGSTTRELDIIRDENGRAMYRVEETIPKFRDPLKIIQESWLGGHGQYEFKGGDGYFEGQSIDTTQEGKLFLGPLIYEVVKTDNNDLDSNPVCFAWFDAAGEWLCATSGHIYRYDIGSSGKWTQATTTVSGVTHFTEYNGTMYAARGSSNAYYYSTGASGDLWTQTDLTDCYAEKFLNSPNSAGTANVLWKFKQPNELTYTTNGKTLASGGVQWSSPAYIGDTSNNITNIFLTAKKLMVGREDSLYHYNSDGGIENLMPELATSISTRNFQYVTDWQVATYFSLMNGLGEIYAGKAYDTMGPLTKIDDIGKTGYCVGLASEDNYLYPVMDEGTNSIIYKGREVRRAGNLRWEWCPWVFLGTNTCATAKVCQHSATDRRLWFGYGDKTAYVILTEDPLADSLARFCASGMIRMSYEYGTNPYWDEMIQSIVTETSACTSDLTVTPKYRKDTDTGDGTALTAAITTNGVVATNLSAEKSCKRIQFELHLATNASTATPIVTYFEARGIEKPVTIRTHDVTYFAGSTPGKKTSTIQTFLRGARTSTSLIKFADFRYGQTTESGTNYVWVIMEPGYPKEVEILSGKTKQPSIGLQCRLKEVSFTVA